MNSWGNDWDDPWRDCFNDNSDDGSDVTSLKLQSPHFRPASSSTPAPAALAFDYHTSTSNGIASSAARRTHVAKPARGARGTTKNENLCEPPPPWTNSNAKKEFIKKLKDESSAVHRLESLEEMRDYFHEVSFFIHVVQWLGTTHFFISSFRNTPRNTKGSSSFTGRLFGIILSTRRTICCQEAEWEQELEQSHPAMD
jgi:hypothetical protein